MKFIKHFEDLEPNFDFNAFSKKTYYFIRDIFNRIVSHYMGQPIDKIVAVWRILNKDRRSDGAYFLKGQKDDPPLLELEILFNGKDIGIDIICTDTSYQEELNYIFSFLKSLPYMEENVGPTHHRYKFQTKNIDNFKKDLDMIKFEKFFQKQLRINRFNL